MKCYKSIDGKIYLGYEPDNKEGYIEITEEEWNAYLKEIYKRVDV